MPNLALNSGPETARSHVSTPEAANSQERSRIRAVLDEPLEPAPDTQPSRSDQTNSDHMLLAGHTAVYNGNMIPTKSGVISVRAKKGGLSLDLDFEAEDGTRLRGYIETDNRGQKAVITDSKAALNNYLRYRYPTQVQELADELLAMFNVSE